MGVSDNFSARESAGTLSGTEVVALWKDGKNVKTTAQDIADLAAPSAVSAEINGVEFDGSTNITVPGVGNVTFPAVQVPSADPNTLDDYEEGTFLAILTADTPPTTQIQTTGFYTKIGRLVSLTIPFSGKNTTGASGSMTVSELPVSIIPTAIAIGSVVSDGLGVNPLSAMASTGESILYIVNATTGVSAPIVAGAGKSLYISIQYFA
jgi:hypothetical protein